MTPTGGVSGADGGAGDAAGMSGSGGVVGAGGAPAERGFAGGRGFGGAGRVLRFSGRIAGFGTASGTRVVTGLWERSPFGRFADVMVEDARGHRTLLAPSEEVADFVSSTYTFDEVRLMPVSWRRVAGGLHVTAGSGSGRAGSESGADAVAGSAAGAGSAGGAGSAASAGSGGEGGLEARILVGALPPLGRMLRVVPAPIATAPLWLEAIDPVARILVPGVRTAGSAGGGRREYYGVKTLRRIAWAGAIFDGVDLGAFAPLDPPVRFGFGSAPPEPHLVDLVTTIRLPRTP
ncbi:hypothetical protein ACEXQD_18775 [Herbiconiux sp. P15]|uniref:hypothetical protein n=1 Tax=Herbiconiux liukaitaii TaxID=3342799 RepID=UPI0035BA5E69